MGLPSVSTPIGTTLRGDYRSRGPEIAKVVGVPLLAQLLIDPELTRLCDEGDIERYDAKVLSSLTEKFPSGDA